MRASSDSSRTAVRSVIFLSILSGLLFAGCVSRRRINAPEGRIPVHGAELYYKIMGNGASTFVLHGGPGDTHETMSQLGGLADRYRLIFYDQRAAGRSTGDADTASHTVGQFVEDLEQLRLRLAPGRINLIGGSWGSMLAVQYAAKHPQNVNAMVLLSSIGVSSGSLPVFRRNVARNRTAEDSIALAQITSSGGFQRGNPETVMKFWKIYFRAYFFNPGLVDSLRLRTEDSTHWSAPGRYSGLRQFLDHYDIHDLLKDVSCPTLMLQGDHDPMPFESVEPIHEGIAGSQLSIVKDAGHWLWVEAPDRVLPLIRNFLDLHESAGRSPASASLTDEASGFRRIHFLPNRKPARPTP
jgi:proline iminopeptidase